jgi:hypothetical protein
MPEISRRQFGKQFGSSLVLAGAGARYVRAATAGNRPDSRILLAAAQNPGCVAMAARPDKITYTGAFGKRDSNPAST